MIILVALGIIVNSKSHVLVAQRGAHQHGCGNWELPGGKINIDEDSLSALQRELNEEIGIKVTKAKPWIKTPYSDSNGEMLLDIWIVEQFSGKICSMEGQALRWIDKNEFIALFHLSEKDPGIDAILKTRAVCENNKSF